jgi:hypothetical protein
MYYVLMFLCSYVLINVFVYTSLVSPITTESPFPKTAHNICNSAGSGGGGITTDLTKYILQQYLTV